MSESQRSVSETINLHRGSVLKELKIILHDRQRQILYDITYMWNLKHTIN